MVDDDKSGCLLIERHHGSTTKPWRRSGKHQDLEAGRLSVLHAKAAPDEIEQPTATDVTFLQKIKCWNRRIVEWQGITPAIISVSATPLEVHSTVCCVESIDRCTQRKLLQYNKARVTRCTTFTSIVWAWNRTFEKNKHVLASALIYGEMIGGVLGAEDKEEVLTIEEYSRNGKDVGTVQYNREAASSL